tara:strand:+ start:22600 stop:23343 length:744 start_codon:yes stop_codon:yes gene_type:complete
MPNINNAYLRYGDQVLFENLSFQLAPGKITCLLGPSGVGKTTLLKLLAKLTSVGKHDELHADIIGADGVAIDLDVAYMAQEDGLMPWSTVLNNVMLGAKLRGEKKDIAKAKILLEQVGLTGALNKKPKQLSGGMRQRVALVRTLMEDKGIVLMDEPFSALDVITRLRLQDLAVELLKGKTVLMITHDPLEALRMSDMVYVMQGQPATFSEAIIPEGTAPRDASDEKLLALQGQLLKELSRVDLSLLP